MAIELCASPKSRGATYLPVDVAYVASVDDFDDCIAGCDERASDLEVETGVRISLRIEGQRPRHEC